MSLFRHGSVTVGATMSRLRGREQDAADELDVAQTRCIRAPLFLNVLGVDDVWWSSSQWTKAY